MELREGLEPVEERMMTTQDVVISDPFSVSAPAGKPVESRFWVYRQNNSGGSFDFHRGAISTYVIIEATSLYQANGIASGVGIYFDGCLKGLDCDCCGDRWSEPWEDAGLSRDEMVSEVNSIMTNTWSHKWQDEGVPEIYLHMLNGEVLAAWTYSLDNKAQEVDNL